MSSELQLVKQARAGDRRALEALLLKHERQLFRFGLKMCGNKDDAADVLQDTLITAARELPRFRGASSLSTWLYAIARSQCRKQRAHGGRPGGLEDSAAPLEARQVADPHRSPEEALEGAQLTRAVDEALRQLSPQFREVLVLRDMEGLTAPEAAKVLSISVQALKSRLHRARNALRQQLAPSMGLQPAAVRGVCGGVQAKLWEALDGELSPRLCEELESHVEGCEACGGACDAVRLLARACRRGPLPRVPDEVRESVRRALRE